eukprot:s1130_g3.t2
MQMTLSLRTANEVCRLSWRPREENQDADDLTNRRTDKIDPSLRVPLTLMAKKMYGFMKRTWSTALAELRRDDKAPDRPEDRRTHFVRAWISDTLWRLYQAGDNWSADPSSMGIDTAEAGDVFSRVLSRPRVLPEEAGGRLPVPPRQWHVVTQAVEDTFEELSEARVVDAAPERKKKRPGKPKPPKGQASRSNAASSHDSWSANADIPFWARKIWDRDNDAARSNSWQGDDQSKDFDRGKGKDRGREKGKEKGREKGKEKGKGKGKGKDKGKDGTPERCQSDSPLRTCPTSASPRRSRTIEERLGGKLPTPRRSRSRRARDRSRRAGRRRASRSRRRRAGGRRRRSVIRDRRPRSAGRTAREDARRARTTGTRRSRSAKRGPTGPRFLFGALRSVSPKMSPKALKLSEPGPPEPTAQSKAKAKARSGSASSYSSSASMETRPKASAKPKAKKDEPEEEEEMEEKEKEREEREESEREEAEAEASPMSEATKLPESKDKGCSSSGSDSSDGSARPQSTKRQASQEAKKDKSEHEKSEEEQQDAVEDGAKAEAEAEAEAGEVFAEAHIMADDGFDLSPGFLAAAREQLAKLKDPWQQLALSCRLIFTEAFVSAFIFFLECGGSMMSHLLGELLLPNKVKNTFFDVVDSEDEESGE